MALFRIKRQNINESALNIDKFDATVQNQISVESIQAVYNSVNLAAPAITSVTYANSSYTLLDDTAANVSGGYIVISGSGFQSGAQITIGSNSATSVTHVNSSIIRAQIPAKDAGSYHLTLINPTGGISILVNGITYSNTPVWGTAGTLDNQAVDTAFAVTLSANSDSNVTYSNTTTLPAGTALLSNGYFYGTISGIESETTYNFTVAAIDEELQDNPREFSVTVTVVPSYQLWVWGSESFGSLGLNNTNSPSSPVQIGLSTDWNKIAVGRFFSAAIKNDGTLWTWGRNDFGSLGHNDTIHRSSPTQVGSSTDWNTIKLGMDLNNIYFSIALKTNGTLWSWGHNQWGTLGLNDINIHRSSPTQVGSGTTWNKIFVNGTNAAAIKTDGTLWMWGGNGRGQLGLNNTIHRSSPIQVGSDTTWNKVSIGMYNTAAIKTNGTLWLWGYNPYGQLGLGNTNYVSSPTQLGSDTTWNNIGFGRYHNIATKTNGTLWSWGYNPYGQLGLGNAISKSSPVQVGNLTNWNLVYGSIYSSTSIKSDGTLWVWGDNGGKLGLNDVIGRSSPVQVGTDTTWVDFDFIGFHSLAIKQ